MPTPAAERAEPLSVQSLKAQDNIVSATSQIAEEPAAKPSSMGAFIFALTLSAFWIGAAGAYLWGYLGLKGLSALEPHLLVFALVAAFMPPLLFIATAIAFTRATAMGHAAHELVLAAERLMSVDETSARGAQRVGRAVRRELDALNAGLDGTFSRLRALETALKERVAQLDEASARAGVKADVIGQHLKEERERIEGLAGVLNEAIVHASETVAGRTAQLKSLIEGASAELKSVGQTLDLQSTHFRDAAEKAAAAPQAAAVELDRQAKRIETAADSAVARAEFVLARQERQRTAMNDLLTRLKDEAAGFENALEGQRDAVERATAALAGEAQRLDELTDQGLRRIDAAMANAGPRTMQLAASFGREADRVKETAENAGTAISRLVDTLREASASAQALVAESTADAKRRAKDFVGQAMAECDRLLRAAVNVTEEAEKARVALSKASSEVEQQMVALPGVAAQEAGRMREVMRAETEQMLDISARTLATLHGRGGNPARKAGSPPGANTTAPENGATEEGSQEGLRGLARRITGTKRKTDERAKPHYELSAVLAAADTSEVKIQTGLKAGAAVALSALEAALADLVIDLTPVTGETADPALWRRYLDGDRGAFARKIAQAIGPETVDRIAGLYRDNVNFRDAANTYLKEFEVLLAHAKDGDQDGLLASTLLTADTGKIYLTVAYALGRLD